MIPDPLLAGGEHTSGRIAYDFRAFLHRGGSALSPQRSFDDRARRRAGKQQVGRLALVIAIHEAFLSRKECGASSHTLGAHIISLREFWKFCDGRGLRFRGLNLVCVRRAVREFATYHVQRFRSGKVQERTAGGIVWGAVGLLAEALSVEVGELVGRTTMPRINSGKQAAAHEKLDLKAVDQFVESLDCAIRSLSEDRLYGAYPVLIHLGGQTVVPYFGHGPRPTNGEYSYKNWTKSRIANHKSLDQSFKRRLPLIQIRVQAECLRFIESTAMNLAQVLELRLGNERLRSYSGEYEVSGFKNRAGHEVVFRIGKKYRPAFERYLKFRRNAFPAAASALFPFFGKGREESKFVATRGFQSLKRVFKAAGETMLKPAILRYAKSQRVIRLISVGGDVAKVSSMLQNTISVVLRSYLVGSQQMAVPEFSKFLRAISERSTRNSLRTGGDCRAPGAPSAIPKLADSVPQPDCINPAGCFFCRHFRGVRSKEYLHKSLSYRAFLRLRAGLPASSTDLVNNVIAPTIARINDFAAEVGGGSDRLKRDLEDVERMMVEGVHHRAWQGWIDLLQLASSDVHA